VNDDKTYAEINVFDSYVTVALLRVS